MKINVLILSFLLSSSSLVKAEVIEIKNPSFNHVIAFQWDDFIYYMDVKDVLEHCNNSLAQYNGNEDYKKYIQNVVTLMENQMQVNDTLNYKLVGINTDVHILKSLVQIMRTGNLWIYDTQTNSYLKKIRFKESKKDVYKVRKQNRQTMGNFDFTNLHFLRGTRYL